MKLYGFSFDKILLCIPFYKIKQTTAKTKELEKYDQCVVIISVTSNHITSVKPVLSNILICSRNTFCLYKWHELLLCLMANMLPIVINCGEKNNLISQEHHRLLCHIPQRTV